MKHIILMVAASAAVIAVRAQQSDTTATGQSHILNTIEVLGIKQMPSTGSSPVTRFSATTVNRLGISAVKNLGDIVPNFYTPAYGSRMTSSIYMRGLGSRIDQAVVGLNIDGVPVLNKDAYDTDIPDIASIDVVRGAQSVLNGRNAMAGQINIYTLSPRDFTGLKAMVEYGRFNDVKTSVSGYFKLEDNLSTSIGVYYNHNGGYWRNEFNNSKVGVDNTGGVRWKTVFSPSAHHTITNTATFSISRQAGYPYRSVTTGSIAYNDTCFYRRNYFSDGLIVAWAGKRVVVTSLTSVQYMDDNMTLDQDFTPADYFTLTQRRREVAVTEDLFTKGTRGKYSWLGGVFGFWRRTSMDAPVTFYDTGIEKLIEEKRNDMNPSYPIEWDLRTFPLLSHFRTVVGGFAFYHESSVNFGPWNVDAGLRWDFERVTCDYNSDADASYTVYKVLDDGNKEPYSNMAVDIHDAGHLKQTFNQLLPKLSVTYNYEAGHVYATFTKGYKSGGFNTQMFSDVLQQRVMESMGLSMPYKVADIVSYKPETSWNYEIGTRNNLAGGKIGVDAVAFLIDCRNQQLTVFPPGLVTGRIMTNAGRTRSMGVELSLRYRPIESVALNINYGYTNAVFRQYNDGKADYRGCRVPYVPAHTLFASALWEMPWKAGDFTPMLQLTARGAGDIYWNESNELSQPFYALAGASFTMQSKIFTIKLWGENITGTRYDTFYFKSMGNEFIQQGVPATFGVTLRVNVNYN